MADPRPQELAAPASPPPGLTAAAVSAALVLVALLTFVPPRGNDLWLHVTIGGMIWQSGEIPATVLFPFAEVKDFPFNAYEWLAAILLHHLYAVFGYDRLLFAAGLFGLAAFGLAWRLAWRLTASHPAALLLALLTMAAINYRHDLRPEIFALLFTLIELNVLAEYRLTGRRRWLAALVPLALLWANCHGSFPVGIAIAGLFALGEAIAAHRFAAGVPYAVAAAAMTAASLVNPVGYKLFLFVWDLRQWRSLELFIAEWTATFSPFFMESRAFPLYVFLLAVCVVVLVVRLPRARATEMLLIAAFVALSMDRNRYIVFFAPVALYALATLIGPLARSGWRPWAAVLVAGVVGSGAVFNYGNVALAYPYAAPSSHFTPQMTGYIEQYKLRGNVLNSYELGAELIHRYYPALRPSIDSRIDSYGEMYFLHHQQLWHSEAEMLKFIADYDVRYMLLLHRDFQHVQRMSALPAAGWRVHSVDHKMVLLGR